MNEIVLDPAAGGLVGEPVLLLQHREFRGHEPVLGDAEVAVDEGDRFDHVVERGPSA